MLQKGDNPFDSAEYHCQDSHIALGRAMVQKIDIPAGVANQHNHKNNLWEPGMVVAHTIDIHFDDIRRHRKKNYHIAPGRVMVQMIDILAEVVRRHSSKNDWMAWVIGKV